MEDPAPYSLSRPATHPKRGLSPLLLKPRRIPGKAVPRFRKAVVLPLTGETQCLFRTHRPTELRPHPPLGPPPVRRATPLSKDLSEYLSVRPSVKTPRCAKPRIRDYLGRVSQDHDFSGFWVFFFF